MKRARSILSISVGPSGAEGFCLTRRNGKEFALRRSNSLTWDRGAKTEERTAALREFLKSLSEGASGPFAGAVAVHPSWTLARTAKVPPSAPGQVKAFLNLWVERHLPEQSFGPLRWAHGSPDGATNETLVLAVSRSLIETLHEAFESAKVELVTVTAAPLALLPFLESETKGRQTALLLPEAEGAAFLALDDGKPKRHHWLPVSVPGSLLGHHLWEAAECFEKPAWLAGGKLNAEFAAAIPEEAKPSAIAWQDKLSAFGTPDPLPPERAHSAAVLCGLALAATGTEAQPPNFLPEVSRWERLLENARPFLESRRATVVVAVLAILFLVVFAGVRGWEHQLYARASEAAEKIALDEFAAEANITTLSRLQRERVHLPDLLLSLHGIKPDNVVIESFQVDQRGNYTLSGSTGSFAAVESFTVKLGESRTFRDAVTQNMAREGREVKFTIRGRLRTAP